MTYIRKRDKERCIVVEIHPTMIILSYENMARAKRAGSWWVTPEQFERLYEKA